MSGPPRYPMTPWEHQFIKRRIRQIKEVERPANVAAIEEALAHGDLKENAEYHSAKEKQGMLHAQLSDLEGRHSLAQVIDPTTLDLERVAFGATVELMDTDSEDERTFQIVGSYQADAEKGLISYDSPIARAMMGKEEGDTFTFMAPGGTRSYEVVSVEYK